MPIEQPTLWTDAALTDPFLIPGIWSSTKPANLCLHQSTAWFPQIDVALYRAPVQTERANPVTHFLEVEYKGSFAAAAQTSPAGGPPSSLFRPALSL